MTDAFSSHAALFDPLDDDAKARWASFPEFGGKYFANHVGLISEEVRQDYARISLPFADHLPQPAGIVHGGAIASMIDTVVVPAVGWPYDLTKTTFATINMHIDYLRPVIESDLTAEGWVERRGRSVVFCRAEVRRHSDGELAATGSLAYAVRTRN